MVRRRKLERSPKKHESGSFPVREVSIHEAKTHLSRLIREVLLGREVVIRKGQEPLVKLVPFQQESESPRIPGQEKGRIVIDPSFFNPMTEEELADF